MNDRQPPDSPSQDTTGLHRAIGQRQHGSWGAWLASRQTFWIFLAALLGCARARKGPPARSSGPATARVSPAPENGAAEAERASRLSRRSMAHTKRTNTTQMPTETKA